MKVFPSTARTVAPFARSMNSGVPPTERKARTGEFTPPGISVFASANSLLEVFVFSGATGASCLLEGGVDRGRAEIVPAPPRPCQGKAWEIREFYRKRKTALWNGLTGWAWKRYKDIFLRIFCFIRDPFGVP